MATQQELAAELKRLWVSQSTVDKAMAASMTWDKSIDTNALISQARADVAASKSNTQTSVAPKQTNISSNNNVSNNNVVKPTPTTNQQKWDTLSYQQQQDLMNKSPELKDYLSKNAIQSKSQPADTSTATQFNVQTREAWTQPTKTESQRDYQSQDDTRMQEIVNNLDYYKVNEPYLFNNYETYRDTFLTGKNRNPEQEALINQYYFWQKQMQEYWLMSANDLAMWLVNGTIDAWYFSYLQMSDPSKAQEVSSAMQSINNNYDNQAYYDSIKWANWFGNWESTEQSKFLQVMKSNWLLVDNNNNLVDDRLDIVDYERYDEYQKHLNTLNELNWQLEDLNDQKRKIRDDLVAAYPWVAESTISALAADRSATIDDQIYELNKLIRREQWDISIYQEEFNLRQTAAQDTINMLQKDYGMYYQYTPEWLSELAQAQYAATNITLDQADSGNYTQKQMALENVLTPIYEQYGSIIQRPQAQVINDVIAYAQKNGVSLSQALEANFMTPLKWKPAYQAIQSQLSAWPTPEIQKIWENQYWYFDKNWNLVYIDPSQMWAWWWAWTFNQDRWVYNYSESWMKWAWLKNNNPWNIKDTSFGNVLWTDWSWFAIFATPEDWFDALVAKIENAQAWWSSIYKPSMSLYDFFSKYAPSSDNNNPKTYAEDIAKQIWVKPTDKVWDLDALKFAAAIAKHDSWYDVSTYWMFRWWQEQQITNPAYHPMYESINSALDSWKLTSAEKTNLQLAETIYKNFYDMASDWSLDHFLNSNDFQNIMSKLSKRSFTSWDEWESFLKAFKNATEKSEITDQTNLKVIRTFTQMIEKKLRKESWAAISSSEWLSNFENYIPSAWETYNNKMATMLSREKNLIEPVMRYSWIKDYQWLFSWDSPYYQREDWSQYYKEDTQMQSTPTYPIWSINAPSYATKTLDLWWWIDYTSLWNNYQSK